MNYTLAINIKLVLLLTVPVEHIRFQPNTTWTSRQVGLQSSVGEMEHIELNRIIYFLVL